jgi:hypothetical protein
MPRFGPFFAVIVASMILSRCIIGRSDKAHVAKPKAYQATYPCPAILLQCSHIHHDGAGHIRIGIFGEGPAVVHVLDQFDPLFMCL